MTVSSELIGTLCLRMGDNCLILGQQLSEWCGHAPALEEDIALANTALDLIGQTRMWFELAAEHGEPETTPDSLAFLRDVREFQNTLLVEQPNTDYAFTLMRQFLFDAWHLPMLEHLQHSGVQPVADIAAKSVKEVRYHLERSGDLVIRLGNGSEESHARMQAALDGLWRFSGELATADATDKALAEAGAAPDFAIIAEAYERTVGEVLERATLSAPEDAPMASGGRKGLHSEAFGKILAEMQWLQRAYPGATW